MSDEFKNTECPGHQDYIKERLREEKVNVGTPGHIDHQPPPRVLITGAGSGLGMSLAKAIAIQSMLVCSAVVDNRRDDFINEKIFRYDKFTSPLNPPIKRKHKKKQRRKTRNRRK